MKIITLIIGPIGDTLFITPALKALRNGFPEAEIEVVAGTENSIVLEGNNNLDRLIVTSNKPHLFSTLMELRNTVYDYCLGLSTTGSYLSYLVNAQYKTGFKGSDLDWIYNLPAPDNRNLHAVDYSLKIAKVVGGKPDSSPELEISLRNEDYFILTKYNLNQNQPLVAVHPGGKFFSFKRWSKDKYSRLIQRIDRELNYQVILIGGSEERELNEEIIDHNHNYRNEPVNLAGKLDIKETAALLQGVDLFIGNDSAPQHLAAAVRTPVITIFGPTNPANFHPYGTEYEIVSADYGCSPCFMWLGDITQYLPGCLPRWIGQFRVPCMKAIKVSDVMDKIVSAGIPSMSRGILI